MRLGKFNWYKVFTRYSTYPVFLLIRLVKSFKIEYFLQMK